MQMRKLNYAIFATIFALTLSSAALSESESAIDTALLSSIAQLQKGWAEVNYQSQGGPAARGICGVTRACHGVS